MKRYLYLLLVMLLISIPSIYVSSSVLEKDIAGMKNYLFLPISVYPYDVVVYRYPWHLYLDGSGYIDVIVDNIFSVSGSRIVSGYVVKNNSVIGLEAGFYGGVRLGKLFEIGFARYVDGSYSNFSISMVFDRSGEDGVIDFHFDYVVGRSSYSFDVAPFICPFSPCYPYFVGMYIAFVNNSISVYYTFAIPSIIIVYGNITLIDVDPSYVVGGSIRYIRLLDGFKGYVSHVFVGETSIYHVLDAFDFYENMSFYLDTLSAYTYFDYLYTVLGWDKSSVGAYFAFPSSNLTIVVDPMYSVYDRYSGKIVFFNPWYPTSYFSIAYVNASIASYVIIDSPVYGRKLYVFRNNPIARMYGENVVIFRYFPPCVVKFLTGEEIVVFGDEYVWYIPYTPNQINIYFPVMYINIPYRYTDYTLTTSTTTITQTIFIKTSTPTTSPTPTPTGFDWSFILLLALLAVFGLGIAFALRR